MCRDCAIAIVVDTTHHNKFIRKVNNNLEVNVNSLAVCTAFFVWLMERLDDKILIINFVMLIRLNFNIFFFLLVLSVLLLLLLEMVKFDGKKPTIIYNICIYIDEFIVDKIHQTCFLMVEFSIKANRMYVI